MSDGKTLAVGSETMKSSGFVMNNNELKNQKWFEDLPMIFNECTGRTLIGSDRSNK